jgi:hypothetical protein
MRNEATQQDEMTNEIVYIFIADREKIQALKFSQRNSWDSKSRHLKVEVPNFQVANLQ